jgi:dihydrofolate synthase/folylpolyglutamate synthase
MPRAAPSSTPASRRAGPPPEIKTFPAAIRYLLDRVDLERMRVIRYDKSVFKLERMARLMEAMGNPQEQVRMVHVAGTVGKGSTVAMIASMLHGCGYTVGEYTSPHLTDVRERIAIGGEPIGKSEFTDLMREAATAAAKIDLEPTFFELLTAMAMRHFAEQAVDLAVIEVGLGGRLDSTNVITPEVTVITRIDYDHVQLLGHTLAAIAAEKAGTIKRGVPVLSVPQEPEVEEVLRRVAAEVGAPIRFVGSEIDFSFRFGATNELGPHSRVCLVTETSHFMHLPVPLPGEHQAVNCAVALATIDTLKASGFDCAEVPMLDGLARTRTPGRMELVWDQPRILVDGAHNPVALGALMRSVGAHVPYDSMVCVFGCCEDKDIPGMLSKAALGGDKIIFTRARGNPRAMDPDELQRQFAEKSGKMSQVARTLGDALDLATRAVGRDDLICVTGSFYLVGETKKHLADLDRKRKK